MTPRSVRVVELTGSGRERGEQYGEQARDLIHESTERWSETVRSRLSMSVEDYLGQLIGKTEFVGTATRLAPDLVDEVEGIARGSGVPRELVVALNLLDEDWLMQVRLSESPSEPGEHCSSFGVQATADAPVILGQNMDLPGIDGLQLLLDIRPAEGPRVLAPTCAGMIATNAFNEHGIGVCVNTLFQLSSSVTGLPVAFMIRAVAGATSYRQAIQTLERLPHASGQNYLVGSSEGVGCFECSATSVAGHTPEKWVGHTNHPVYAEPQAEEHATHLVPRLLYGTTDDLQFSSTVRLSYLERRLADVDRVDVPTARAFLTEPPLCRGSDGTPGFTFYSVIMEPAEGRMWLTAGPPDRHDYEPYSFEPSGVQRSTSIATGVLPGSDA